MGALVVGPDGTAIDPSDREAVVNAAVQAPGVEDADINDGDIINATQNLNAGPGMMKYSITLPDGLPFECSPFQIEHRRDMSKMWMAAVRQEILNRAGAAAAVTREAALAARRKKQMEGPGILVAGQLPTADEAAAMAAAVRQPPPAPPESARAAIAQVRATEVAPPVSPAPAPSTDPAEYAKQQLEAMEAELAHWQALQLKASRNAKTMQKAVLKWKTVLEAFSEDETNNGVPPVTGRAAQIVSTLRAKADPKAGKV